MSDDCTVKNFAISTQCYEVFRYYDCMELSVGLIDCDLNDVCGEASADWLLVDTLCHNV